MFPWQSSTTGREQRNFIIYNLSFFSSLCCNDFSFSASSTDLALQMRRTLLGWALKVMDLELSSAILEQSIDRKADFGQSSTSFLFIFCRWSPWGATVTPPRLFLWGWGLILLPASADAKHRSTHRFGSDSPHQLRNRYLHPSEGPRAVFMMVASLSLQ